MAEGCKIIVIVATKGKSLVVFLEEGWARTPSTSLLIFDPCSTNINYLIEQKKTKEKHFLSRHFHLQRLYC